jgi:hypothetical protein
MSGEQEDIFGHEEPPDPAEHREIVDREWVGMPEYANVQRPDPVVTATFKFRSVEDFDEFLDLLKKHVYGGAKVFDGTQRVETKSTWYPLFPKPGRSRYR